jgi:hypothetical protein
MSVAEENGPERTSSRPDAGKETEAAEVREEERELESPSQHRGNCDLGGIVEDVADDVVPDLAG